MHVDRAVEACERPPERLLGDVVLAHDTAGIAHQHLEHVELDAGEREVVPAPLRTALFRPQDERADLERPAAGTGLRSAQDRAQPSDELARRARLGNVVVRAKLESDDAIDVVAARGEHYDRHAARLADLAQRLDAVDL